MNFDGEWSVPKKYIKQIGDTASFARVVMVDRTMQAVMTLERVGNKWLIRSMNPCSTGAHKPPYESPTPLGIYVIQEKRPKMLYTNPPSTNIAGYAPWANRFCAGGFVHGVPVNGVNNAPIEFSPTLGTIPRSHMCVRNATSHAKFIYDWAPTFDSLVAVIE
jgi:lipoprotein-anchoring transpeptidase ErfK/SrfK